MFAATKGRSAYFRTLAIVGLTASATLAVAPAANADYFLVDQDSFNFVNANQGVRAAGYVNWYQGARTLRPDVFRGQFTNGSTVRLARTGCAYVQIGWNTLTGSASWPPAGSASTTSDGWYRQCGSAGTAIDLAGQSYASTRLFRVCLNIGYSASASQPRSWQSNWCAIEGGR
ncbi:hypothetical protein [Tsukamurella pseudospumae]|uniref:hypothetical protein n=1 Tax=Tsukamurella pseudospumae TaxID=239498 RepID=UPI0012E8CCBD|nr:hypothetical protein [Tsukamurella pseudospumae]